MTTKIITHIMVETSAFVTKTRNILNKSNEDYLFDAIYYNDIESVKKYLNKLNIDYKNAYGYTPLMYACYYGYEKLILLFVKAGANPNLKSDLNETVLQIAIKVAKSFLNKNINYNRIIDFLIHIGTDIDSKDYCERSALMMATKYNNLHVVESLISAGADLNLCDNTNYSALKTACYYGHVEIVKLLLDNGAKITAFEQNLKTSIIVNKETREKLVELLSVACYIQTKQSLADKSIKSADECCICYSSIGEKYVLIPCGHYSTCKKCVDKIDKCPLCSKYITNRMRIFD